MDAVATFSLYVLITLTVSLLAAALPLMMKLNDRQSHLLIAFSSGIFLGALFLMFMPEALHESIEAGYTVMEVMYAVAIGFLAVFIFDVLLKYFYQPECSCNSCIDHHSHDITSISAFVGLAIHAFFDGLALASAFIIGTEVGVTVLLALCIHKVVVVFSLSSTFLMSNRRQSAWKYLLAFCLISPVAAVVSYLFLGGVGVQWTGVALALSAGIFMFVTLCNMVPESFHREEYRLGSLGLLLLGIVTVVAVVAVTAMFGGHLH